MGNQNSQSRENVNNWFPAELIDYNGNFNIDRFRTLARNVKFTGDSRFVVVSIVGKQISGKSTLMNCSFGTEFKVMNAENGRFQTTKGIWVEGKRIPIGGILVIDTEGTDGQEREDDASFERQTIAFALATSNVMIVNMMCSEVGQWMPLIKTLFEVKIRQFIVAHKVSLQFVLRDKTKTSLDKLEKQLRENLEKIWCSIPMPQSQAKIALDDHFNIEVMAMSNYESDQKQFEVQVAKLRERIFRSCKTGAYGSSWTSALDFIENAKRVWDDIKKNKDLDLPHHKIMEAEVRCKQIFEENYKSFLKDESWIQIQKEIKSGPVQEFGKKVNSLLGAYLSSYDMEALTFDEAIRDEKREQLLDKLLQVIEPLYMFVLEQMRHATLENFKKAYYSDIFLNELDNLFADAKIEHANWNHETVQRKKFEREINARRDKLRKMTETFEFDPLKVKNQTSETNWSNLAWSAVNLLCVAIPVVASFFFPALPLLWLVRLVCVLAPYILSLLIDLFKILGKKIKSWWS